MTFSGGIKVILEDLNHTNPIAEVVDVGNNQIIDQMALPKNIYLPSAEQTINCGGIDYAGTFHVRIVNEGEVIAQTDDIQVFWPRIVVQVPDELETLSGNVKINFEIRDELQCNSIHSETEYTLELWMYPHPDDLEYHEVIREIRMSTFNNLGLASNPITLNCALFDQEALFEVSLWFLKTTMHFLGNYLS